MIQTCVKFQIDFTAHSGVKMFWDIKGLEVDTEAFLEPSLTSMMKRFVKIVNEERSIIDVRLGSKYAPEIKL